MGWVDAVVLVWVAVSAFVGYQRGLTVQLFSLAGLALGGLAGARLAPALLSGGDASPWVAVASLAGAVVGALLVQALTGLLAQRLRTRVRTLAGLRLADAVGGVALGLAIGVAIAWLAAVAALQLGRPSLSQAVQRSPILSGLVEAVPPRSVLRTLAALDPLPLIVAPPDLRLPEPDPSVLESGVARRAGRSVVKVEGVACGSGVQGSGWAVAAELVATNAHVVAGTDTLLVLAPNGQQLDAELVYLDTGDDVALLRVPGLDVRPLPVVSGAEEGPVILLGYPNDGGLMAAAGSAGRATKVLAPNAYGESTHLRTVVPLRGSVRHGDSGGPVVDGEGAVLAMMFAATQEGDGGFGVPVLEVLRGLEQRLRPIPSGPCVR